MAVDSDSTTPNHGDQEGKSIYIDPVTGQKIPMKDGKPCRTCVDMKTWKRLAKVSASKGTNVKPKEETKPGTTTTESSASASASSSASTLTSDEWQRKNCPPDVETLGSSTWTLLHTMAAYYPDRPAPSQMESMKMFFEGFAQHYPCWFCKASGMANCSTQSCFLILLLISIG